MNLDRSSAFVIGMVQELVATVRRLNPAWTRAFWRFESEELRYGSNASYVDSAGANLISAIREQRFYDTMNASGRKLWESQVGGAFRVCLLVIDSSLNYEMKFEMQDVSKWRITKSDGGTGMPEGL